MPIVFSFACFVIYYGLLASMDIGSGKASWGYGVFLGLAFGTSITALMTMAQLSVPAELIAPASSLMIAFRSVGTVGIAIYNAIFTAALHDNIGPKISQAALSSGLPPTSLGQLIGAITSHDDAAMAQIPGITPGIIGASVVALKKAYLVEFRNVYTCAAAFAFVAVIVAALFLKDPKDEFTSHVDAPSDVVSEKTKQHEMA
ncbi:hypothetical protein LTS08_007812 [Lithohypha guttulata]|nr:hypothetical protein LTS08_007812 [Lithohypha guttulata]